MAKIALVGDAMLDVYHYCINRNNPESSAPCYTVKRSEYKPGGAANVAANLKSLGANFEFISLVGSDANAQVLRNALAELQIPNHLIEDSGKQTITKMRFFGLTDSRYHDRYDFEDDSYVQDNHVSEIFNAVKNLSPSAVLISDYKKGIITRGLMDKIKNLGVPVIVDPKSAHREFYKGVFVIKPNKNEVIEMTKLEDVVAGAMKLGLELGANVLLSRSEEGMSYFGVNGERYDFSSVSKQGEVVDPTGAGDSVVAAFTHFFVKNYPIRECVKLANKAGGIAVRYSGCYHVKEKEILE